MRAVCHTLADTYQAELQRTTADLRRVEHERDAYLQDVTQTAALKVEYAEGKRAYEDAVRERQQWEEERCMLKLRLEQVVVENERLQLALDKSHRRRAVPTAAFEATASSAVVSSTSPAAHQTVNNTQVFSNQLPSGGAGSGPHGVAQKQQRSTSNGLLNVPPGDTPSTVSTSFSPLQSLSPSLSLTPGGPPPPPARRSPPQRPYSHHDHSSGITGSGSLPTPSLTTDSGMEHGQPPDVDTARSAAAAALDPTSVGVSHDMTTPSSITDDGQQPHPLPMVGDGGTLSSSGDPHRGHSLGQPLRPSSSHAGMATTTCSSVVSTIPLLFQVPRSPAEALATECTLHELLNSLTVEVNDLRRRLKVAEVLEETAHSTRSQRAVVDARHSESLKRQVRVLREANHQLQSELRTATANWHEVRDALGKVQEELSEMSKRLHEQEAAMAADQREAVAALTAQHEEERQTLRKECTTAVAVADSARLFLKREMDHYVTKSQAESRSALQAMQTREAELSAARRALRDAAHAHEERIQALTAEVQYLQEKDQLASQTIADVTLARDTAMASEATLREALLEKEAVVEEQQAAECIMASRLQQACEALTNHEDLVHERDMLIVRLSELEKEVEATKDHGETQLRVLATALTTLQGEHHDMLEVSAHRYEKLLLRYRKVRLQVEAAVRGHWGRCLSTGGRRDRKDVEGIGGVGTDPVPPVASGDWTAADGSQPEREMEGKQGGRCRRLRRRGSAATTSSPLCDPRAVLRESTLAIARIGATINGCTE